MENKEIIAHFRESDRCIQTNREHCEGVARLAERFAREIGMPGWGQYLGWLHDKGKEKNDFQTYIRIMNDLPTDSRDYHDKTHAYVGALLAKKYFPKGYQFVAYALAGHHAGMPDCFQLNAMFEKPIPDEVSEEGLPQLPEAPVFFQSLDYVDINHVLRLLYSCLVDADYLDTETFMNERQAICRGKSKELVELLPALEEYLKSLESYSEDTPVNRIRKQVQDACRAAAYKPIGVYSLTVPTGGGKTLSSVLWAMLHAIHNGKKRIILSIPYTSIITQTASILKKIFGEENVLEHHSNIQINDNRNEETVLIQKLAAENWDFPIIVTTNVQLLESMYSSHPSKCRKLHNIANSVILFDEVQTLPGERLQPIVDALKTYHRFFGISLLFTTASQPTLEEVRPGHEQDLRGFDRIEEIIPAEWKLYDKLKRVHLCFDDNPLSYQSVADCIMRQKRVLCIVNTRKDACEIFSRLPLEDSSERHFHLSRMMCAEHLDDTLYQIKDVLKRDGNTPVRVVSTQLVEAGVDIDFPVVLRQEAGLDSILQAAGRCNREGRNSSLGVTEVFRIEGRRVPVGTLNFANQARRNMPAQDDWFSPEAMSDYFTHFYYQIPTFDKRVEIDGCSCSMHELLCQVPDFMFDTADRAFQLIDSDGYSVVVNYKETPELISQLRKGVVDKQLFRKLNRYAVNINARDFEEFLAAGMLEDVCGIYYLSDSCQYDENIGLKLNNHWINETLIL